MPQIVSNINGLNLYTNPLMDLSQDGQVIRAVNVDSVPYGAKSKRTGYGTYAAGALTSTITDLFSWTPDGGTTPIVYANAGGSLFYSHNGTEAWTICGNGTIISGSHVGRAVLNNTLVISQNGGTTRHSTNGTSFSDTAGAPTGEALEQFQNRVYITGTANPMSYSVTGDPTNWASSGTSDGGVVTLPGAGLPTKLYKLSNRLYAAKQSRNVFAWDGYSLVDTSTNNGMSSPYSYGSIENNGFWLNEKGFFTSSGDQPQLISNNISRFIQNALGSGIAGTSFPKAPGEVHYYDYLCAVGSMTDDFTNETVANAIVKYNFQKNEFLNWSFAHFPTDFHSYIDEVGVPQLIFGDASGNTFQLGTQTTDAGQPIESIVEIMFDYGNPLLQKDWRIFWGFFNPGCGAQVQIATSDTFIKEDKHWITLGPAREGVVYYRFRQGDRSRFLYVKITETSTDPAYELYGIGLEADLVPTQ